MNSPIRFHGGKSYLAARIVSMFPPHTHYAEPFFGGGSVLFAANPEGVSETINDINGHLTNFWKVLRRGTLFYQFVRLCQATPFSEESFDEAKKYLKNYCPPDDIPSVMDAYQFFVLNRMGRQGLGKSYATPSKRTRRGMNENVSSWLSAIEKLPEVHKRLQRVEIRRMDFEKFIRQYDHKGVLIYLDPPYLHETRNVTGAYQHEMSNEDHVRLLNTLTTIQGRFIISGYPSHLYDSYCQKNNWNLTVIPIDNKASSAKTKEIKNECLWYNF